MSKHKSEPLRERLSTLPDDRFWRDGVGSVPSYRKVLHDLLASQYPDGAIPVRAVLSDDYPHPSTFQRAVAAEAERRRKLLSGK